MGPRGELQPLRGAHDAPGTAPRGLGYRPGSDRPTDETRRGARRTADVSRSRGSLEASWIPAGTWRNASKSPSVLAFITVVCSRHVVGWVVSASLHTAGMDALGLRACACQHGSKPWQAGPGPPLPIRGRPYVSLA